MSGHESSDERDLESADDLYEHAPCGFLSTLPDGTIVRVNQTFLDLTGFRREDLVAKRRFQDLLTVGGRIYHETHFAPLLRMQGHVREIAAEIACPEGRELPVLINSSVKFAADGTPLFVRTTIFNATDRRRYEQELLRVQEEATTSERRVRLLRSAADRMASATTVADVARALESVVLEGIPTVSSAIFASIPGETRATGGRRSSDHPEEIEVPLGVADRPVGLLTITLPHDATLDDADLDLVKALALQAGPAVERAHLYEGAVEHGRRTALSARIVSDLIQVPTVRERVALVEQLSVPDLADAAAVVLVDDEGDIPTEVTSLARSAMLNGSTVRPPAQDRSPVDRIALPLCVGPEPLGAVVLTRTAPRRFSDGELEFLRELADRVAFTLANARLLEQERSIAHTLQAALLAGYLPQDPRFDVATLYQPAERHLDVGGDWFDVFHLGQDRVGIVVGDVVGRGIEAASAMGQLRSATRAVAGFEVGPARVIERLDGFVENLPSAWMATMVYAEIELEAGTATYACAGHLPPALLTAAGDARLLWDGRSTPLGVPRDDHPRSEGHLTTAAGDSLILYTDGLVERRGEAIDDGLDRLLAALTDTAGDRPPKVLETITTALRDDLSDHDDVCALCIRLAEQRDASVRKDNL
jgi:serine/threonine-protein kinase RsbW